jgi:ADP-ribose pyrophosphatase YjhB (NUDIX family)
MKFCPNCGGPVTRQIPPGDDRPRDVCDACQIVHYHNPKMVVGCIPEYGDKILLCRRSIEPRLGFWTIPAGFLENRETVAQGARREALEETGSEMEILDLVTVVTLLPYHQVYMIFRARLLDENYGPTEESSEVRLFGENEIPWSELAFETIQKSLELYFQDRAKGAYALHMTSIGQ